MITIKKSYNIYLKWMKGSSISTIDVIFHNSNEGFEVNECTSKRINNMIPLVGIDKEYVIRKLRQDYGYRIIHSQIIKFGKEFLHLQTKDYEIKETAWKVEKVPRDIEAIDVIINKGVVNEIRLLDENEY